MSSDSQISCEIDLSNEGTQSGFLRVPHSVHRSAYGWIPVPIISIRNGEGPVVLLIGGNHGDEFEGQVALSRLAQSLQPDQISGQVIILPMANYPAARAGLRTSPLDDGNLNRCFPGNPQGTPTEMMAHHIESVIMPRVNYMLDIHSGGSSMRYRSPTLLISSFGDSSQISQKTKLADALGFPRAVTFSELRGGCYSTSAAYRQGALSLTAEMAGGGNVDRKAMSLLSAALPRFLAACGVYHGPVVHSESTTAFFTVSSDEGYLYARNEGIFEEANHDSDQVDADMVAGWIHYPDIPLTDPVELRFQSSGVVLSSRVPARVERGDCLFEIGVMNSSDCTD